MVDNIPIESIRLRTNPTYNRSIGSDKAVDIDGGVRRLIEAIFNCISNEDAKYVDQMINFFGFRIINLEDGDYVIDTNMIYHGIHNLPVKVEILYCAQVEVLYAAAEKKHGCESILVKAVELAFEHLRLNAAYVPTAPYECDVVLPTTDRVALSGKRILTMDRGTRAMAEVWTGFRINNQGQTQSTRAN